jgi:hypothetical protein
MTVMITRLDQDASDMRVAAARSADAKVARRLLALERFHPDQNRSHAKKVVPKRPQVRFEVVPKSWTGS